MKRDVLAMAARWNAVTNWKDRFKNRSATRVYTIELQEALMTNHPALLYAEAEDIRPLDSDFYRIDFHDSFSTGPDIKFILACTGDQVTEIRRHGNVALEQYAVVAKITKVVVDERTQDDLFTGRFTAVGRCLDLLYVGDEALEN